MRKTDLMERPSSRDLLASWYSSALEEQATSGLSMAEFADELGVSAATLYQWRRRLADNGERSAVTESSEPKLIEVLLADRLPSAPPSAPTSFTVWLTGSRSVEVPADFDAEALQRIVRTLESC